MSEYKTNYVEIPSAEKDENNQFIIDISNSNIENVHNATWLVIDCPNDMNMVCNATFNAIILFRTAFKIRTTIHIPH